MRRARSVGWGVLLALTLAVLHGCAAFGTRATGAERARMEQSPEWQKSHFVNPQPLRNDVWRGLCAVLDPSPYAVPDGPVDVVQTEPSIFKVPAVSGVRVTWFGHSSTLVEVDGTRVLTDPVWSDRATFFPGLGPKRFYLPPIPLADLPHIDAVVISHNHYDHLDYRTIVAMKDWDTTFIVPLGVGADLLSWGVPASHVVELDWWQQAHVGALEIVSTPARHASGRHFFDQDVNLWTGYALIGPAHRVYFSGDTGLFPALREVGARLGPFDLTMIEVGQYDQAWPDWHIGPEQAVRAHQMVGGKVFLPIHWAAFALAAHGWTEPIERARVAAREAAVNLIAPRPGESIEPSNPPPFQQWWPNLPWKTAKEAPIVSTQVDAD